MELLAVLKNRNTFLGGMAVHAGLFNTFTNSEPSNLAKLCVRTVF